MLKRDVLIAMVLFLFVAVAGAGYYWNKGDLSFGSEGEKPKHITAPIVQNVQKKKTPVKNIEKKESGELSLQTKPAEEKEEIAVSEQIDRQRETAMRASYQEEPAQASTHTKPPNAHQGKRARLVIIIDDVASWAQLKEIGSVPLSLTPSLFPPSNASKETARMAKKLKHYMIHFPMQAGNHPRGAMPDTVTILDSKANMHERVKELRGWFPACIYTNNHTGSVFTSDYRALHTMYGILKEEGFVFVDSRTSSQSKGREVAKAYGDFYLHRDVFIDNIQKFGAIREQLKAAVKQARKQGYAIAIGHPHPITIRSLKNSLDILVDVDVVFMDELMK